MFGNISERKRWRLAYKNKAPIILGVSLFDYMVRLFTLFKIQER